jgi:hypothetical protein
MKIYDTVVGSSPLKNPTPCFDKLSMSGSPTRFHYVFPLTLSLSKGAQALFQRADRRNRRSASISLENAPRQSAARHSSGRARCGSDPPGTHRNSAAVKRKGMRINEGDCQSDKPGLASGRHSILVVVNQPHPWLTAPAEFVSRRPVGRRRAPGRVGCRTPHERRPDREPAKGWTASLLHKWPPFPRGTTMRRPAFGSDVWKPQSLYFTRGRGWVPTIFWDADCVRGNLLASPGRALIQMGDWCGFQADTNTKEDPGCVQILQRRESQLRQLKNDHSDFSPHRAHGHTVSPDRERRSQVAERRTGEVCAD